MQDVRFEVTDVSMSADADAIDAGLQAFNLAAAPFDEVRPLICTAKLHNEILVGGVKARTWGECCELQQIWVLENYRRSGIGRRLMVETEVEAARRGCTLLYLETFNFQAPEFYRQLGFDIACEFHGFPDGIVKYILRKAIGRARNKNA
jgi:ribosomal protein S18 acetylase RimI-like enzyme